MKPHTDLGVRYLSRAVDVLKEYLVRIGRDDLISNRLLRARTEPHLLADDQHVVEVIEWARTILDALDLDPLTEPSGQLLVLAVQRDEKFLVDLVEAEARALYQARGVVDESFLGALRHLRRTRSAEVVLSWLATAEPCLTIFGSRGNGKSLAARLALAHLAGRAVHASDFTKLSLWEDPEEFVEVDLLIIDDVWRGKGTVVADENLFDVIERRNARSKRTLLTTNLRQAELEDPRIVDPRLLSRLAGNGRMVPVDGPDFRLEPEALETLPVISPKEWAGAAYVELLADAPDCHRDGRTWTIDRDVCAQCPFTRSCREAKRATRIAQGRQ